MTKLNFLVFLFLLSLVAVLVSAASDRKKPEEKVLVAAAAPSVPRDDPVLVGAGDIASCDDLAGAEATAKLIDKIPGTVFAAGDLA